MKICFISTDFPPTLGGVASHAYELSHALSKLGHQVTVISSRVPNTPDYEKMGQVAVFRPQIPWQKPFYNLFLSRFLKKYIKQHQPDLVHIHGMRPLESTQHLPVPVVFTNHTSGFLKRLTGSSFKLKRIGKRLQHVQLVLAPSMELCEATRAVGYTGPVDFISNGVDTQKFTPNYPPHNADTTFLLARRLVEKNGVLVFAQALTLLKNKQWQAKIAGVGSEMEAFKAILQQGNVLDKVQFLGPVANSQMPAVYQLADVSVLPSFYEATSITGLESMACGLPLIGTNVGGIPYLIDQDQTGWLVPSHNPEALANAMDDFITLSAEQRQQISANARQKAVAQFDWLQIAKQTEAAYVTVLN